MRKRVCLFLFVLTLLLLPGMVSVVSDRAILKNQIIRLHVVGATDGFADQNIKLQVKDAVVEYLQNQLADIKNAEAAKSYLHGHLDAVEKIANTVLAEKGFPAKAKVTFTKEAYPLRRYDSFALPSGVYESLIVTLGAGKGKNWWCVIFPSLCAGATGEVYESIAADAGLSYRLINTAACKDGYEIRFFLLDCIGKLENLFHFR